jgi:predicted nucleic acid-binding protein
VIIIADTSPIISLAVIDKLEILDVLFDQIAIPEAVWLELLKYADVLSIPGVKKYQKNIISVKHSAPFIAGVDAGESEAIMLFEEIHADFLLIDDNEARKVAESRAIPCLGTLAVLITAKSKKIVPALRPLFMRLLANNRFYSVQLLNNILASNNEPELR